LVELINGSVVWGVAFEDGDWAEDVRLGDPEARIIAAAVGGGVRVGGKRKHAEGADTIEENVGNRRHKCSTCGGLRVVRPFDCAHAGAHRRAAVRALYVR